MKNIGAFILFIIGVVTAINSYAQAPVKENLYTLKANESMVYGENCFFFSANGKDIFMVIKGDDGYYTIDNGVRKGPFKEMNEKLIKPCKQTEKGCAAYEPKGDSNEDITKYIMTNDDGTSSITFNGKTFGPFMAPQFFELSDDKTKFAAVVMEQDMSKKIIMSNGKTIKVDGMVSNIMFSPDGSLALFRVGFDFQSPNLDPTKITMEQASTFSIMTSDGVKFGPYNGEKVTDSDIWFSKSTGNHWFLRNGDDLLLDGKPFMKMPEYGSKCDLWFSNDCKRYAVSNYERVKFSDGSSIPYPIQTSIFYKDGKAYIRCITVENEKEINVYTKAL